MKILVMTPDGDVGRRVTAELLSPEFTVRLVSADPGSLPDEWREHVRLVGRPTDNADMLSAALAGVQSVFWCIPSGTDQEIAPLARALSVAMRKVGTPRLVTLSMADFGQMCSPVFISRVPATENILGKSGAAIRHLCGSKTTGTPFSREQLSLNQGAFSLSISGNALITVPEADALVNVVLRWLVRHDWTGIERLVVSAPGSAFPIAVRAAGDHGSATHSL